MTYKVQVHEASGFLAVLSTHEREEDARRAALEVTKQPRRPGGHGSIIEIVDDHGVIWSL